MYKLAFARHNFEKISLLLRCLLLLSVFMPASPLFSAEQEETTSASADHGTENDHALLPWYGELQYFGSPGLAQRWVNIPGQVDPQAAITSLTYSLNNGPERHLNLGPDSRRLSRTGDFNVELDAARLQEGANSIRLSALSANGAAETLDITVRYHGEKWPLPYTVDWQSGQNIQQAVQIVDGLWQLTARGLRTNPDRIGYDRGFAIGDRDWASYEVFVPLTIHRVDTGAFASRESARPGFGIVMHWRGHTDTPINCGQPRCGWLPSGAQVWHFFNRDGKDGLDIITTPLPGQSAQLPYHVEPGFTYFLRARVENRPFRNLYFMKIWQEGEQEPRDWTLRRSADTKNPDHGGMLIIAHHVDMTVGNIEVLPVPPQKVSPVNGAGISLSALKEYLVPLPLFLSLIAGGIVIRLSARQGTTLSPGIPAAVCLAGSALLLVALAEPFFPDILTRYALNAKLAAGLYLGLDLGRLILQTVLWLLVFLFLIRGKRRNK